ncbi:MAG: hypothetical protein WDO70_01235 [Alphaproteobacteria bacterium]
MTTITATFDNRLEAEQAVTEMTRNGVDQDHLSLLMSDNARRTIFGTSSGSSDVSDRAAKAGVTGASIGGALAALVAGLTAVGSLAIPGSSFLVVGPVVAALSGASAGAIVGGLTGALIQAGLDEGEASRYEAAIRAGKIVLVVHPEDEDEADAARRALRGIRQAA